MSGGVVSVRAQWALHGKARGSEGYRVLACSTGELSQRNFADALSRFQLGALDTLPQVSVSYAQFGGGSGESYLALASHEFAAGADRPARDENGARITYTRYFCVPYPALATRAISYQALHEAVRALTLPTADGPPLPVSIPVPARLSLTIDPLAMRVAALLLTGLPVCVLGAEATTSQQRLRFIDAVMGLLPYGMRARMTAATWTRATYRDHRFRLFFSSARRITDPPDHMVTWDHPERTVITPADGPAFEYLTWLEDTVGPPLARLSELTGPLGFTRSRPGALSDITAGQHPALSSTAARKALPRPAETPPSGTPDLAGRMLPRLARSVASGNLARARDDIARLRDYAAGQVIADDRRARYREMISEHRLLRSGEYLYLGMLYDALLRLAFQLPLSYEGYCQLEDCLERVPPGRALLEAIERGGTCDQVTAAIVCWQLRQDDAETMEQWYAAREMDVSELIRVLAGDWEHPRHARILCDLTLDYLAKRTARQEARLVRRALRQHGFLAQALLASHSGSEQYQVSALCRFLMVAYPDGLTRSAITAILTGSGHPPTPALLAAVLILLPRPADRTLAREAYTLGVLSALNLSADLRERLTDPGASQDHP